MNKWIIMFILILAVNTIEEIALMMVGIDMPWWLDFTLGGIYGLIIYTLVTAYYDKKVEQVEQEESE